MKQYNHYNLNPPEPVIIPVNFKEQEEEHWQDIITEHNFEESYNLNYIDKEELRIKELIKNEEHRAEI